MATPDPENVPMPSTVPHPITVPVPVRVPDEATGKNPPTRTVPTPLIVPVPFAVPQPSTCGTLRLDILGSLESEEELIEDDGLSVMLVDDDGPRVIVMVELEITSTVVMVDEICVLLSEEEPDGED